MTAAATTLRDTISTEWALTGELNKVSEGSGATLMDEVVQFFDRFQVVGNEVTKAVIVQKINSEENETVIRHPNFNEIVDIYEITVRYRVIDVNADNYSDSLDFVEQMATEVVRILRTVYNPSSTTNIYFRTMNTWTNEDVDVGNQRDLQRKLRFTLTTITSDDPEVYSGFGGVLVFDTSESQGDSLPVADYTFVSVKNINADEGFSQIPTLTKDKSQGVGVPLLMRGQFSGTFSALMYAQKTNIIGSTIEKLQNIYRLQGAAPIAGQVAEVVLLRSNTNRQVTENVTRIRVTDGGSGYTTPPTVLITGGSGSGATAVATISDDEEVVTSILLTDGGSGYFSPPSVIISGGGGTGAEAVASLFSTLTRKSFMKINRIKENEPDEDLVSYTVIGTLSRPTIFTESTNG